MFVLRILSIELPRDGGDGRNSRAERKSSASQSFIDRWSPSTAAPVFPFSSSGPNIEETRGILHLFRNVSEPPASVRSLPVGRGTAICVLAVPNYMSYSDFCDFCGSYVEHMVDMRVIRDDGMEDRYSILITFDDQINTDNFYRRFNGKKFPSAEAEVCHILFSVDVQYTDSTELAGTPPPGFTELPSCPACLGIKKVMLLGIGRILTTATHLIWRTNVFGIMLAIAMFTDSFSQKVMANWLSLIPPVELLTMIVEIVLAVKIPELAEHFLSVKLKQLWMSTTAYWQANLRIKEKEKLSLRSRDENILDLEEQVRDIMIYIEAQKTLEKMPNSDDIKGGTVLPVQRHSSSAATKRSTKINKRRS